MSTAAVTLTLAEIEALRGKPLPRTAYARSWWALSRLGRKHVLPWAAIGWRVGAADFRRVEQAVTFVRTDAREASP